MAPEKEFHHLNTPPDILDMVRMLSDDGRIGLDPCSNATSMVDAETSFDETSNGLGRSWRKYGLVFVNPPHSMSPYNIEPWMAQAHRDFIFCVKTGLNDMIPNYEGDQIVLLVPAKPDTDWFHSHAVSFPGKCFLRGRIKYWENRAETPGPGKFGSMLLYAGNRLELFRDVFGPLGWCP